MIRPHGGCSFVISRSSACSRTCCGSPRHGSPAPPRGSVNAHGPDGLKDSWSKGNPPRLSVEQQAAFVRLVETGPDRAVDGVVRWRRVDLQRVVAERFGVRYHERTIGKLLKGLGFAKLSPRPVHPEQDTRVIDAFRQTGSRR